VPLSKPHHIVADIDSGNGFIAENIFELFALKNPVNFGAWIPALRCKKY